MPGVQSLLQQGSSQGKPFRCPLTGCWRGEAVGGLTRSRASCVIVRVHIWLPLIGPKFEVGTKNKRATSY